MGEALREVRTSGWSVGVGSGWHGRAHSHRGNAVSLTAASVEQSPGLGFLKSQLSWVLATATAHIDQGACD